jgi:dTDP-4-amino-4,6-dideoxygalactose transaminase
MENLQLFHPVFRIEECLTEIRECLIKGWTGLGFKTIEFEEAWKKYSDLPYAHFINSNTAGLHLALYILKTRLGWKDGDEIITTPLTFVSTNHSILYTNLKPVFTDIDEYLCLDPEDIEKKISSRTRAIIFVGLGGNVGQYAKVLELCHSKGLAIILDAAHMAGTRLNGVHVGKEPDVTVFSFQAVKNLPTADSGMICFRAQEDDARARKLSWLGINKDTYSRTMSQGAYKWLYDVEEVGFKYHGNSVIAALGLVQLRYLDQDNAYRRQLACWYRENLSATGRVKVVPVAKGCESATHLLQIMVEGRDEVMLALHEHGIYPGMHYRDNTEYPMYSYASGTCPNAHEASKNLISLPLHLGLTKDNVKFICDVLIKIVGK